MKYYPYTIVILLLIFFGCSNQPILETAPELEDGGENSLSGIWIFDGQDEQSLQHLRQALNYVPLNVQIRQNNYGQNNSNDYQDREQKILRDLLVGTLSIAPEELYILQTNNQVTIDFGVAGYHTFNILQKTEILMDGFKIEAFAGWKLNDLIIQLNMGSSYQLIEKFTLVNGQRLEETIELQIVGRDKLLTHRRYFKKKL